MLVPSIPPTPPRVCEKLDSKRTAWITDADAGSFDGLHLIRHAGSIFTARIRRISDTEFSIEGPDGFRDQITAAELKQASIGRICAICTTLF